MESQPTICRECGSENRPGRRFCRQCGGPLERVCAACGVMNEPTDRYCGSCGTALGTASAAEPPPAAEAPLEHEPHERRFVSVLFADLVGFTQFSESLDHEVVRRTLTLYYDRSREIVERFGGSVQKFIGDAVMAVWGATLAHEDDAERAVRAGLELIDMVARLGEELEHGELELRVGILTGEASVGPAVPELGLVVGVLVNTASRLQTVAAPGTLRGSVQLIDWVLRGAELRRIRGGCHRRHAAFKRSHPQTGRVQILDPATGGPLRRGHLGKRVRGTRPGTKVSPVTDVHMELTHVVDERSVEYQNPLETG